MKGGSVTALERIATYYGVPARRRGRVEYSDTLPPRQGTIVGSHSMLLRVHPTWQLRYLDQEARNG